MIDDDNEFLGTALGECLNMCIAKGFELPYHVVALGLNGSLLAARYFQGADEQVQVEFLAEHYEDGTIVSPINVLVVDARGEAARLVFTRDEAPKLVLN